jgi:plasmid stability protein
MATLTIRNLAPKVVRALKAQAARNRRSMEQEVREMLESQVADRTSVIEQVSRAWATQKRAPTADEVETWMREGRP